MKWRDIVAEVQILEGVYCHSSNNFISIRQITFLEGDVSVDLNKDEEITLKELKRTTRAIGISGNYTGQDEMERHCSGDPNRSQKSRVSSTDLIGYPRCPTKNKNNYVIPIFVHRKRVFSHLQKALEILIKCY